MNTIDNTKETSTALTEAELRRLCNDFVAREVIYCQTSLVEELMNLSLGISSNLYQAYNYDNIQNLWKYQENQYYVDALNSDTIEVYRAIDDRHVATLEIETVSSVTPEDDYSYNVTVTQWKADGNHKVTGYTDVVDPRGDLDGVLEYLLQEGIIDSYDELHEAKDDCESDTQEIFEWWSITSHLRDKLLALGEPILDNDYGTYWGRTTTGQSISLDYCIRTIVKASNN